MDDQPRSAVRRKVDEDMVTRDEPYEELVFVNLVTDTPWPLGLAILIALGILISMAVGGDINSFSMVYMVPAIVVLGAPLFLNFTAMQKNFAEEKEEREFSSKYAVLIVAGMFAALLYFMVTHTLFSNIAVGGTVPFVLFQLIKRFSADTG